MLVSKVKYKVFDTPQVVDCVKVESDNLMQLHSPVDLTGNLIMFEKLVLGGTWTGNLLIFSSDALPLIYRQHHHLFENVHFSHTRVDVSPGLTTKLKWDFHPQG